MGFSGFFVLDSVSHSWSVPKIKMTDLYMLCKYENLQNRQCIKYLFSHCIYIYKVRWQLVDSAISATSIADRCIKFNTQLCNLHKQTLAVEWPYWRAHWLSTQHRHSQQVNSSYFCQSYPGQLPWSTVRAVIVKYKYLGYNHSSSVKC
jgi:hypothetical protein